METCFYQVFKLIAARIKCYKLILFKLYKYHISFQQSFMNNFWGAEDRDLWRPPPNTVTKFSRNNSQTSHPSTVRSPRPTPSTGGRRWQSKTCRTCLSSNVSTLALYLHINSQCHNILFLNNRNSFKHVNALLAYIGVKSMVA